MKYLWSNIQGKPLFYYDSTKDFRSENTVILIIEKIRPNTFDLLPFQRLQIPFCMWYIDGSRSRIEALLKRRDQILERRLN